MNENRHFSYANRVLRPDVTGHAMGCEGSSFSDRERLPISCSPQMLLSAYGLNI